MEALQDKRVRLQPECKKRLQDRIDMWSYAAKVSNPICTHKTNPQKIGGKKTCFQSEAEQYYCSIISMVICNIVTCCKKKFQKVSSNMLLSKIWLNYKAVCMCI